MEKRELKNVAEKKRIAHNIIAEMFRLDTFLLLGHRDPDTDCIASLAACGLLLRKLQKEVLLYLTGPVGEQFSYLLAICKYNGIAIRYGDDPLPSNIGGIIILDTPKPEMIALNDRISGLLGDPRIRKIEIDHHLQTDAAYQGDPDYSLVSEASSTCEHLGYLCFKLSKRKDLPPMEIFSRNVTLALLTGMVGDSHLGKFLKSEKERWYYRFFSTLFDKLLVEKTNKDSANLASMEAIFDVIQRFSVREKKCFDRILKEKRESASLLYVILDKGESEELFKQYDTELLVNVSKAAADTLAEERGKLGMICYYDPPEISDFIQFRLRRDFRYTALDLRKVLEALKIGNGGGHPGAIGFRVKQAEIQNIEEYVKRVVNQLETLVDEASP